MLTTGARTTLGPISKLRGTQGAPGTQNVNDFMFLEISFPNLFNYFPNLNSLSLPTGCAQNILIWSLLVQHSVQQLLIGYPILSYSYPIKHQLYYYPINLLPILLIVLPIPGKILDPYNNFWIYPPCPPKYIIVWGIGVVPNNFFLLES